MSISCFIGAAVCPLVLYFLCAYFNIGEYLSLDWADRIQMNSFWFYESVLALMALLVIKRNASRFHRRVAWSSLAGCMIGLGLGIWMNHVAVQDLVVIGP